MLRRTSTSAIHGGLPGTAVWLLLLVTVMSASLHGQSARARTAVEAASLSYRDAWLANDEGRVMSTLTSDAVIFPSNLPPIAGADAIRRFWFPPGVVTRVVDMAQTIEDVSIDGGTAVVSGTGSLTFVVVQNGAETAPRTQRSWFVNILRRQPDGRWLIWRRMWGDTRQ
jgi:ketosteroid isomerase-like protein